MLSLVYVSSASQLFSDADLVDLLKQSRENNTGLDVSGMLLYKDGNFMQVLEGDDDVVHKLTAKIKLDPRHKGFLRLMEEQVSERHFPDWSMGFKNLTGDGVSEEAGYTEFLNEPLDSPLFQSDPGRARKLLRMFRKNN